MQSSENSWNNPVVLRHDLMIEAGRLEMLIEDARNQPSANDQDIIAPLETKLARVSEALDSLARREQATNQRSVAHAGTM